MLRFNKNYFAIAFAIFIVEVLIALYARNGFVRSYLGDVLVVVLIYCFLRSFLRLPVFPLAAGVLMFAFVIEFLQYLHIIKILGLEKSEIARTIIGTSFAWLDIVSYIAGFFVVLIAEKSAR